MKYSATTLTSLAILTTVTAASAQGPNWSEPANAGQRGPSQTAPTFAPEPTFSPAPTRPQESVERYGGQLALVDAAAVVTAIVGARERNDSLTTIGVSGLVFGAPAFHLYKGNSRAAVKSLAVRVGLPLAGALIGFNTGTSDLHVSCAEPPCKSPEGSLGGMFAGFTIGAVTALVIDYGFLARRTVKRDVPVQPNFGVSNGGFVFGASGRF